MSEPHARWSGAGYADVVGATRLDGEFEVDFANGDSVTLPAAMFGVTGDFAVRPDEDGLGVVLTGGGSELVVSWSQLRAASEPEFAQELRRRDAEEARRIGLRLRALREDRNLSQRDVASWVGMTPPQLSKIENGSNDLRISTLQSLLRAMGASLSDITGSGVPEISRRLIELQAEKAGAPRDLVRRLLDGLPRKRTGDIIHRAFGWDLSELASGTPRRMPLKTAMAFKTTKPFDPNDNTPTIYLAQTVADIVNSAYRGPKSGTAIDHDPAQLRTKVLDTDDRVTLDSLASWLWRHGIPVLPLQGRGGFAAAVLQSSDRPVIVLKDSRDLAVYWLFDLAHEVGHQALGHVGSDGIVDVDSPSSFTRSDDVEAAADRYALSLLIPNYIELLAEVRRRSQGNYLRFKSAVSSTARAANVSAGLLGVIAAYELTEIGEYKDRWGSATNLARLDGGGYDQIAAVVARNANFESMDETDRELIAQLISF